MNIKIHTTGGNSFKDLAAYLMRDANAQISDRVAWTETRNLATQNPEVAWRVMAATAMNQVQLKKAAGIGLGGRKAGGSVVHLSISWKDKEALDRNLDRTEMMRLVDTVLANYGATKPKRSQYADEHQALVVCHRDKKHPHLHVVVNRTHPEHGVYLPDGNDYLKMSGAALNYERESGRIWSPKREVNWAQRERKQYAKYHEEPRNVWQAKTESSITKRSEVEKVANAQRSPDAQLHARGRELNKRHRAEWQKLSLRHTNRISRINAEAQANLIRSNRQVADRFASEWTKRLNAKEAAFNAFQKNEDSFIGRMKNRADTIDFGKVLSAKNRLRALRVAGEKVSSPSSRRKTFQRQERNKDRELSTEQHAAEIAARLKIVEHKTKAIAESRERFHTERDALIEKQSHERSQLKQQWRERNDQRKLAFEKAIRPQYKVNLQDVFAKAKLIQERQAEHAATVAQRQSRSMRM